MRATIFRLAAASSAPSKAVADMSKALLPPLPFVLPDAPPSSCPFDSFLLLFPFAGSTTSGSIGGFFELIGSCRWSTGVWETPTSETVRSLSSAPTLRLSKLTCSPPPLTFCLTEFHRHKKTDNPLHIVGFLQQWKMYLELLEDDAAKNGLTGGIKGKKMDLEMYEKVLPSYTLLTLRRKTLTQGLIGCVSFAVLGRADRAAVRVDGGGKGRLQDVRTPLASSLTRLSRCADAFARPSSR